MHFHIHLPSPSSLPIPSISPSPASSSSPMPPSYHHVIRANAMVGSRAWVGGLFTRTTNRREKIIDLQLTPQQEQRLQKLQERINTPFDETRPDHQEALRSLWKAAFPNVGLTGLVSEQWKDMGWQGAVVLFPLRTCCFSPGLTRYAFLTPVSFRRLLLKQDGNRATWEYPFAAAGINISFMLIQMLDLQSAKPRTLAGVHFMKLLAGSGITGLTITAFAFWVSSIFQVVCTNRCLFIIAEDEAAFDVLFCIAFEMMDAQWLAMHASYMDFNEVLQVTRTQLERELCLDDINMIKDLPAYNLLYQ
ncbi:hypothetical protein Tsubulata_024311 [Turnera subulata]|uniref:ELMO domain-containing protein n=1 Tax=Turnera subulata TaxID=218843 RepID=A0A9Q0F8Q4_9ROSI|nr:hypothetical protein Tsubulata_024311 [Turnera subulata]